MTATRRDAEPRARARHPEEETRYRALGELDAAVREDRDALFECLDDPSWRVRTAAVERLASADPGLTVPALVEALSRGATIGARDAAAKALARVGPPAVPALVERLASSDPDGRQSAARVLGAIGEGRAIPSLTARLADGDPNVRAAAAEALGRIGGSAAAGALTAALDSDDRTLRLAALEALVAIRACLPPARAAELLADRTLRIPTYRLLGASDDPGAVALIPRGLADGSRATRAAALAAIGQQRARRSRVELAPLAHAVKDVAVADPSVADACAAALGDDDLLASAGAVAALGWAGAVRHVPALVRAAETDALRPLVEEALDALQPGPELRAALAEALPSLGSLARLTALGALARLGSPAAFESVVRQASDPDDSVQTEAIQALGRLGETRAVAPLAGLLGDDAPTVAGLAAAALVQTARAGAGARAAALAELRARAGASPSAALYRALGELGEVGELELVLGGLRREPAAHRIAAVRALAALARRRLVPQGGFDELVRALADEAAPVRAAAARAVADALTGAEPGASRRAGAAAALLPALRDADAPVRAAAAGALGACGLVEHGAALAALVDDPSTPVVVAAVRALTALGCPPPGVVARAAANPDPEVVKEAVLAAARVPGPDGERVVRDAAASPRWVPILHDEEFRLLREVVHARCGLWFREELKYLVERRLAPRLHALGLRDFGAYHHLLRYDSGRDAELDEAIDLLTINETYFHREPQQLRAFVQEILPQLAAARAASRRLRIVSAGCATGEEAYTLAVLLREARLFDGWDVEVLGADISRRCLAQARGGAYGEHAFRMPESEPMRRWFRLRGGKWIVDDAIRGMVRFSRENLLDPRALAWAGPVDAVFCRNVMIYFDLAARRQALRRFHEKLRDGGWLLLGHAESLLNVTADFELVHLRDGLVYRKPGGPRSAEDGA